MQFKDKYQKLEQLGEGTYGVVHKAIDLKTNKHVALKKIKLDIGLEDEGVPSTTIREISILQQMKHQNLVLMQDIHYSIPDKKLYLIFEYVDYDLKKFLDGPLLKLQGSQLLDTTKVIIYQILLGVDYMHKNRVLHRDLKPQNILVSKTNQVKIADFGLARNFCMPQGKFTKDISTLWYRAPELMMGDENYSIFVDIWATGIIMAELLYKKAPFQGESQIDMLFKIYECVGTPNDNTYAGLSKLPDFKYSFPKFDKPYGTTVFSQANASDKNGDDLLKKLLILNPVQRLTAKEALLHPFFDSVRNLYK